MFSHDPHTAIPAGAFTQWVTAISAEPNSIGWQAAVASLLESGAFKPGNVHPAAGFHDLDHADFVAAAQAIAEPFGGVRHTPAAGHVGSVILAAVEAAVAATQSNANLGIVLALAPLAAAAMPLERGVCQVLAAFGPADAAAVWQAIALAHPGGLGRVERHDVAGPPPADIIAAMRMARDRDAIARLWADGYEPLFRDDASSPGMVPLLERALNHAATTSDAILHAFLHHLACHHDSLVARRHGDAVAAEVSREAAALVRLPAARQAAAIAAFDTTLRAGRLVDGRRRPINPGTTADLTAAALFVLLRRGWQLGPPSLADTSGPLVPLPSLQGPSHGS